MPVRLGLLRVEQPVAGCVAGRTKRGASRSSLDESEICGRAESDNDGKDGARRVHSPVVKKFMLSICNVMPSLKQMGNEKAITACHNQEAK